VPVDHLHERPDRVVAADLGEERPEVGPAEERQPQRPLRPQAPEQGAAGEGSAGRLGTVTRGESMISEVGETPDRREFAPPAAPPARAAARVRLDEVSKVYGDASNPVHALDRLTL